MAEQSESTGSPPRVSSHLLPTFAGMYDRSPDLALVADPGGRVVYANRAALRVFGRSREATTPLRLDDAFVLVPEHRRKIQECLRDGNPGSFETVVRAGEAEAFPVEVMILPLRTDAGVYGVAVMGRDVTERECIEEALRKSERFLHDVFDGMQDGISVLDRDLNIVRVNAWIEKVFAAQMPLVGRKCYAVYQSRESTCPWCPSQKVFQTGLMHSEVVPYRPPEGAAGWMDLVASPLRDADGSIIGVIEYVRDITGRKLAEEAVRESEEKYRVLVEQSLQGIVVVQGMPPGLVFANRAMADMLGYTVDELLLLSAEQVQALIHADDRKLFFERYRDRVAGKSAPGRYEVRTVRKDGAVRWIEMSASRIEFGGEPAVQAAFVDVTDRKNAESRGGNE
jgi:PAS domain S-box-containing protein